MLDYSKTSLIAHWIRDEIREVSPGIYLGLVYLGQKEADPLRAPVSGFGIVRNMQSQILDSCQP